jgi:hypothetical protein
MTLGIGVEVKRGWLLVVVEIKGKLDLGLKLGR